MKVKQLQNEELLAQINELRLMDLNFFPYPWKEDDWKNLSFDKRFILFALQDDLANNKGFALFELIFADKRCELLKILIIPDSRGLGYGSFLLMECVETLKAKELDFCLLEVACNNTTAIKTYQSMGFTTLVRKKNFYSDGGDALTMQLSLK